MKTIAVLLFAVGLVLGGVFLLARKRRVGWVAILCGALLFCFGVAYKNRDLIKTAMARRANGDISDTSFTPATNELQSVPWPSFRGGDRQGHAVDDAFSLTSIDWTMPTWQTEVSGAGQSSPCVSEEEIYVTAADLDGSQFQLIAYGLDDGQQRSVCAIPSGDLESIHANNSYATSSPATDGQKTYVLSCEQRDVFLTAVANGQQQWSSQIGRYWTQHGLASSPCLYHGLVICAVEGLDAPFVVAVDSANGNTIWRKRLRPSMWSYSSPLVVRVAGKDQLLLSTAKRVLAMQPLSGETIWELPWDAERTACTMVATDDDVVACTTDPAAEIVCIKGDGQGLLAADQIKWRASRGAAYITSPVVVSGRLIVLTDDGILSAISMETGELLDRTRLGGDFFASLTAVGNHVLAINSDGKGFVVDASGDELAVVNKFQLDGGVKATPAVLDDALVIRTSKSLSLWRLVPKR